MRRARPLGIRPLIAVLALGTACADTSGGPEALAVKNVEAAPGLPAAADVLRAMGQLERQEQELWPGFRPDTIPLLLFDDERTWLAGYPAAAPQGFTPAPDGSALVYAGRHELAIANSGARLGDVPVAVVMLSDAGGDARDAAATAIHEKFHVHQSVRHPDWAANELQRFSYPVDQVEPLFLRRMETRALSRAAAATTPARASCWLSAASVLRERRFEILPDEAIEYERALERSEGLARYVAERSLGRVRLPEMPSGGFAPEAIRARAYLTGEASASALDMLAPGWRQRFEQAERPALDSLLARALSGSRAGSCGFSADERAAIHAETRDAIDVMASRRAAALRQFQNAGGWTLRVIAAHDEPLWPQNFDPMNIVVVGEGRLLHERMLQLGNASGTLQVLDRAALTVGTADDDPLGQGVREARVAGLEQPPAVQRAADGDVLIRANGVSARFGAGASVQRRDSTVVVRVPAGGALRWRGRRRPVY